jgi:hypothetical protein
MSKQVTITLDDDVAERLDEKARREGASLAEVVNQTIRQNLQDVDIRPRPFTIRPRHMGPTTGLNMDCTEQLLNEVEGPNWK